MSEAPLHCGWHKVAQIFKNQKTIYTAFVVEFIISIFHNLEGAEIFLREGGVILIQNWLT